MITYERAKGIMITLCGMMVVSAVIMACYMTNFYYSDSTVYAISGNVITFKSGDDLFEWIENEEDIKNNRTYSIGDAVTLKLSTNGTDNTRLDDAILSITKE